MIGDFSSFIELCAAVYFTMCIDSEKFRLFWNPNRKVTVENVSLQSDIDDSVRITRDNEILSLRRMGVFMIVICFLLLILVGFEPKISVDADRFAVPVIISYSLIFVLELIHNGIFKLMKVVVISLGIIVTIFLTLWYWDNLNETCQCDFIIRLYDNIDILTTLLLLLPLVFHVIRLWLRSSVQRGYLRSKIEKETVEYQKAIQALTNGVPSGISKKYLATWAEVKNPKDPDPDTTPFTDLYIRSIVNSLYPNDLKLLGSFTIHWVVKIWRAFIGLFRKR